MITMAWLSCSIVQLMGRPRRVSHKSSWGTASLKSEAAGETISASVVERLVEVCFLHSHARGKKVLGPAKAKKPPEGDRVVPESPHKSASVKHLKNNLSAGCDRTAYDFSWYGDNKICGISVCRHCATSCLFWLSSHCKPS